MRAPIFLAIAWLGVPALAQSLWEVSAKVGTPLSDTFETGSYKFLATGLAEGHSATRRYTVGAGLGLRVRRSWGVEADILYQRLGYDLVSSNPSIPVVREHTWTTANSWEFPLQLVYRPGRIAGVPLRISGGPSWRAVSGETTAGQCVPAGPQYANLCGSTTPGPLPSAGRAGVRSPVGVTVGAGMETRIGPVRLTPEARYTRWRADAEAGTMPFDLRSNQNQVAFLIGVGF